MASASLAAVDAGEVARYMAQAGRAAARGEYETALEIWAGYAQAGLGPAAKGGDALAQSALGDLCFNGEDGTPNRSIAEEWYARAAGYGDAHAQDMLSWMLVDSDHRKPDHDQAMQWALKAAAQSVAASMTRIGLLYNNARGVERDVNVAAHWWRRAALLGDADGQAMLGAAHHIGAGVPRDAVGALTWLIRARAGRSQFADRFYLGVRESCTAAEIAEAESRAAQPLELAESAP